MTNIRQSTDYVFEGKVNVLKSTNKNMFRVYLYFLSFQWLRR